LEGRKKDISLGGVGDWVLFTAGGKKGVSSPESTGMEGAQEENGFGVLTKGRKSP